ncbi:MAG: hypothetical protein K1X65_03715 [Caldilineales bacterium]|nr:hypothetical protein [Caldilineales bacterium]
MALGGAAGPKRSVHGPRPAAVHPAIGRLLPSLHKARDWKLRRTRAVRRTCQFLLLVVVEKGAAPVIDGWPAAQAMGAWLDDERER